MIKEGMYFTMGIEEMKTKLLAGEAVKINGIGTLKVGKRAARRAYDFNTNRVMDLPACLRVKFKASKKFSQQLNEKK